ncbi:MAG: hypothetical protein ACAH89_14320 [Rariglobus sp.]
MESANGRILWEQPLANGSGNEAEARLMPRGSQDLRLFLHYRS